MLNEKLGYTPEDDGSPDKRDSSEVNALDTIHEAVIKHRAKYIDLVAQLIEGGIHNDPVPERSNFSTDFDYEVAVAEWDARMAAALRESAELHGRMLELEELQAELRLVKKYIAENKDK